MLLSDIGVNNLKSLAEYYCLELKDIFKKEPLVKQELEKLSKTIESELNVEKLEDWIILISDSLDKIESIVNKISIENKQDMKDFMKSVVFSKLVKNNLESAVECISIIKYLGNNAEVEGLDQSTVNNSFAIQLLKGKILNVIKVIDSLITKDVDGQEFKFFENYLNDIYKAEDLNEIVVQTKNLLAANDEFLLSANKIIESKNISSEIDFDNLAFLTVNTAKAISESSSFIMTTSIVNDILGQIN